MRDGGKVTRSAGPVELAQSLDGPGQADWCLRAAVSESGQGRAHGFLLLEIRVTHP